MRTPARLSRTPARCSIKFCYCGSTSPRFLWFLTSSIGHDLRLIPSFFIIIIWLNSSFNCNLNAPKFFEFLINCPIYFFFTVIGGVFFFLRFTTSHSPWVFIRTFEFFWVWLVDEFEFRIEGFDFFGVMSYEDDVLVLVLGFLVLCRWIWR